MRTEVSRWQPPPERLLLPPGMLHLWRFDLDQMDAAASSSTTILTVAELARARRLRDPLKQRRFRAARATLRRILSRYLNTPAAEIQFDYSRKGKPGLAGADKQPLHFNLAHSRQQAVLGVTLNSDGIGIDLEFIDPQLGYGAIAERFFSEGQRQQLASYPPERQRRGFYRLWTQLEASLKHSGKGLGAQPLPLSSLVAIPTFFAPAFVCNIALTRRPQLIQRFTFQSLPG